MIAKIAHPDKSDRTELDDELYAVSCGYYHTKTENLHCLRANGRCDYFLYYVVRGKSTYKMNGKEYTASEGDVIFYNFMDPQEYLHLASFDTQVYWLHFYGTKAKALLDELGINKSTVLQAKLNLGEHFENIIMELTHKSTHYHKSVAGNIQIILANISRRNDVNNDDLDYVITLMNSMENNRLPLDQYAKLCNISKSQFIRRFKSYTGETPIRYKNKIIMKNAKWYLENSNYTISEIATILQFENVFYFSSAFKKETGYSPSQYKEEFNNN